MRQILHQLGLALITLWIAATLTFWGLRLLPGDAIQTQYLEAGADQQEALRRAFHLDDPLWMQYVRFLADIIHGQWGVSLYSGRPVPDILLERLPPTLSLTAAAMSLAVVWGVAGGIAAATAPFIIQVSARLMIGLALSLPIYWTGTLVIFVAGIPLGGVRNQLLLPALILGFHTGGVIAYNLQANIRIAQQADFVRTAYAKGLPTLLVMRRHVLRVGLLPIIQIITLQTGVLLGGAVITESLFQRAGIGLLLLDAVQGRDYPVVQGVVLMMAAFYILANYVAEMLTHQLDPRLRYQEIL